MDAQCMLGGKGASVVRAGCHLWAKRGGGEKAILKGPRRGTGKKRFLSRVKKGKGHKTKKNNSKERGELKRKGK